MSALRCFYVTQEELVVLLEQRGVFGEAARFAGDAEGYVGFSAYLRQDSQQASIMLVDVIEEEFAADRIPRLPSRDRNALIQRRLDRKYSRTPYRLGHLQGSSPVQTADRSPDQGAEHDVLYSAVSNPELLDPWLEIIANLRTPLTAVLSVPLLGLKLLARIRKPAGNALLLTQHQGTRLRQVYLREGRMKSARLSQSPPIAAPDYGDFIFNEILRSRRYLERSRLLGGREDIDVYMITDPATADRIIASDKGKMPIRFHFIKPETAAKAVRLRQVPGTDSLEMLYLAVALQRSPGHNYALPGQTRYHRLSQARSALIAGAMTASLCCAITAGAKVMDGLSTRSAVAVVEQQIQQMEETFRRENERFAPVQADSHEMKHAVDTGDFVLDNRLPVAWVMQQLGHVLGDYPEIQIDELRWQAEAPAGDGAAPPPRRGSQPQPVAISPLAAVSAEFSGQIVPFDGDMRAAFATLERLAESLRTNTAFDQVQTTELPLDANPASAISGDLVNSGNEPRAHFRVKLRVSVNAGEAGDEAD